MSIIGPQDKKAPKTSEQAETVCEDVVSDKKDPNATAFSPPEETWTGQPAFSLPVENDSPLDIEKKAKHTKNATDVTDIINLEHLDYTVSVNVKNINSDKTISGADVELHSLNKESHENHYQVGKTFGKRYATAGEIARGGMGIILDGKDLQIRRQLAIKVLLSGKKARPDQIVKFIEEAQIQGQLEHPNICPVHELGIDAEHRVYFTMKKVKGQSLSDIIKQLKENPKQSTYSLVNLLEIFTKVCDGVAFAHSKGVIHRDLKPDNIMIGEFGEVLVMDWGLAKIMGRKDRHLDDIVISDRFEDGILKSMAGSIMGTPSYMSPEQAKGFIDQIDERSDIYALGTLLYFLLTLHPPIEGKNIQEVLTKVICHDIVLPSKKVPERNIPPDLEAAVMKALANEPKDRYASVKELKADIIAFLEGRTLRAANYSLWQLAQKWYYRNKTFALTTLSAIVVLNLFIFFFMVNLHNKRMQAYYSEQKAHAEASRAKLMEVRAQRQYELAEKSRQNAERRLAEAFVAQGDALMLANRWQAAERRYLEAIELFHTLNLPTFMANLGMWAFYLQNPLPLNVFTGHSNWIEGIAFSSNGRFLLSGSRDNTMKLWDVATGREIKTLQGHDSAVRSVAFSPDDRYALSGSWDKTVRLWDLQTGQEIKKFEGHTAWVNHVAFSPDGRYALSGSNDMTVKLWDIATGQEQQTFLGHTHWVQQVAFAPDGKCVISCSMDGTVKFWDIETGHELRSIATGVNLIRSMDLSQDGRFLILGTEDAKIKLWNLENGYEIRSTHVHTATVCAVKFSANGQFMLSSSEDATVKLWNLETGQEIRSFVRHESAVCALAFSSDMSFGVSGSHNNEIYLWRLWQTQEVRDLKGHTAGINSVALSSDARIAFSGSNDKDVKMWDVATGQEIATFSGHSTAIKAIAVSPDYSKIITGCGDTTVNVWDITTDKVIFTLSGHLASVEAVSVSSDGQFVLSGSKDKTMKLWDLKTGTEIKTFTGHTNWIKSVAFSKDGRFALSGSMDKTMKLWDLKTGTEIKTFTGHTNWVQSVAFSPDGEFALSGSTDQTLKLWNIQSGVEIRTFKGHNQWVQSVAFSPDGRLAASASTDQSIKIWDVESGLELRTLTGHTSFVTSLAFAPNGQFLISGSDDQTLRIWDFSRPERYPEYERETTEARNTLKEKPDDAKSLLTLGTWYAFQGIWKWAGELFKEVPESETKNISPLEQAYTSWNNGDLNAAIKAFEIAKERHEASSVYLDLCLQALNTSSKE